MHPYEQIWQSVKNTIHDNSHNKDGRQLQFTPEVTFIGIHIVSKFQPNPSIIANVIDNFVHGNFFQDHCVVNCIKIKSYSNSFQDHPFLSFSFQDHCILVYFQHNGIRTAHISTTQVSLALRGPADSIQGMAESCHTHIGSVQHSPRKMVCQHNRFPGHRRLQAMATARHILKG